MKKLERMTKAQKRVYDAEYMRGRAQGYTAGVEAERAVAEKQQARW